MERIQEAWPGLPWGLLWVRSQPASKPNQHCSHLSKERPQARARTETPWTLQAAAAGATSGGRRRAGTTRLKSESKPEMSDSKNQDDVDDEITAVFAEGEPGEDGMSKSWHGSRSARCGTYLYSTCPDILRFSQKSLSFFVDISGAESPGPAPALTRSIFFSPLLKFLTSHIVNRFLLCWLHQVQPSWFLNCEEIWQGPFSSLLTNFDQVGSYIVKRSNCARLKLL